jgi:hypothetical protein
LSDERRALLRSFLSTEAGSAVIRQTPCRVPRTSGLVRFTLTAPVFRPTPVVGRPSALAAAPLLTDPVSSVRFRRGPGVAAKQGQAKSYVAFATGALGF